MNLCGSCRLDFGSVAAFDAHRIGRHEYTFKEGLYLDPPREDGRRCLDEEEIAAAVDASGASLFVRNGHGKWSLARSVRAARSMRPDANSDLTA